MGKGCGGNCGRICPIFSTLSRLDKHLQMCYTVIEDRE